MAKSHKKMCYKSKYYNENEREMKRKEREANIKINKNVITNYNTNVNSRQMNKTNANEYNKRVQQRIKWNLVFKFVIKMHLHLENRKTKQRKSNKPTNGRGVVS